MKKGLLAVALLGLSLVAGGALAEPKPVIGALIRNLDDQFLGDYTGNLKKLAVSKGVELKVMDAHSDMATQLDQLNTLISQGVKYFVVVPAVTEGSEQLASIIAAKKGGAAFSNTAPTVAALKKTVATAGRLGLSGLKIAAVHGDDVVEEIRSGAYTLADFDRAVRHGVTPDGRRLYPAMPYPSYVKMSDEDIWALRRGGHDPQKVYAAYHAAVTHKGQPTHRPPAFVFICAGQQLQ